MEVDVACRGVTSGAATDMGGRNVRADGRPPSEFEGATLPVRLLGVEEETLIEIATRRQCLGSKQQHGSDNECVTPAQATKPKCLRPRPERCRERPADSSRAPALRIDLGRGRTGQIRSIVEEPVQSGDTFESDSGVGIQKKHVGIRPATLGEAKVDSGGKPEVCSRVDVAGSVRLGYLPHLL